MVFPLDEQVDLQSNPWELAAISSTMLNARRIPEEITVRRSDPVYNAHMYLTKVPISAIEPFIEAFTKPGDLVVDVFAGSGMTGISAATLGRRAYLVDISELGSHIGRNYLNLVEPQALRRAAHAAVEQANARLNRPYRIVCSRCGNPGELSRRTWSVVVTCQGCAEPVNFYRSLEEANWRKSAMRCPKCNEALATRNAKRIGEEPVLDTLASDCSPTLLDQIPPPLAQAVPIEGLDWPNVEIGSDRQMFQASALGRHNLRTVADFFSRRNLAALAALRKAVGSTPDDALRAKLMFAFTAILGRASKRYQWSRQRPLNAANQTYYIAPVFYEWNVFDLFSRKIEALIRSDDYIRSLMAAQGLDQLPDVRYVVASAESLSLDDESVDYVFTDPPFGSNIFYSDMNIFQEAWLGRITDHAREAVVDRSGKGTGRRTSDRYEGLLTSALSECWRVLKPNAWLSLVFSNTSGEIWALLQRALATSGFVIEPEGLTLLDKGQRSVKGLSSGVENVVTSDLVISVQKRAGIEMRSVRPSDVEIEALLDRVLTAEHFTSPSHVYLAVVQEWLRNHWDLAAVSYRVVSAALQDRGLGVDPGSGRFVVADRLAEAEL